MGEDKEKSQSSCSMDPDALPLCPCLQVLEYNVVGGKYNRGITVLVVFRELVEPRKQDADSLQRALTVGWCIELVRGQEKKSSRVEVPWVGWGRGVGGTRRVGPWLFVFSVPLACHSQTW